MRAERGKVAIRMGERLEIHRKRYSDGVMLFGLAMAMVVGIVVMLRVPSAQFGALVVGAQDPAGAGLVGGLLKTLLAMGLVGLLLLAYWLFSLARPHLGWAAARFMSSPPPKLSMVGTRTRWRARWKSPSPGARSARGSSTLWRSSSASPPPISPRKYDH